MRILVTGASGLVGAVFTRMAGQAGHEVVGVVGKWSGPLAGAREILPVDLADGVAVRAVVRAVNPEVVLNAAAVAEPAMCEADPARARKLNVDLPAQLALEAERIDARLIHLSSEQVFDGEHAPYAPDDPPNPLNLYGRQKAESERAVLATAANSCVVRPPLLIGNSPGGRRSMHERMFESWSAGKTVRLYTDEIRQVCLADHLAVALLELAERRDLTGVFHWAGSESVSRWELGRRIAAHFAVAEKWIEPMRRADTPEISAGRPRDLSLRLAPLDRALHTRPASLAAAVGELVVPAQFSSWHRTG